MGRLNSSEITCSLLSGGQSVEMRTHVLTRYCQLILQYTHTKLYMYNDSSGLRELNSVLPEAL